MHQHLMTTGSRRQRARRPGRVAVLLLLMLTAVLCAVAAPQQAAALISTGDGGWVWQDPLPQGSSLTAVDVVGATRAWAVGDHGTILATTNGGTSWNAQRSGTSMDLSAVDFVDAARGWAVGGYDQDVWNPALFYEYYSYFGIWATVDGGATWTLQIAADRANLRDVAFADATHGWAVGHDHSSGDVAVIFATTDGGATWSPQDPGTTTALNAVCFPDATHGWAVGEGGAILSTSNGGATWTAQTSGTSEGLLSVCFPDATHGWAVGSNGVVLVTANGGASWTAQTSGTTSGLRAVSFADATHGWAAGDGGVVLVTADGGTSWATQSSGATGLLAGIAFADATHGCAVGRLGTIRTTVDGGATWTSRSSAAQAVCSGVSFADASHGWAVGGGGAIVVTANGGAAWTAQTSGTTQALAGVDFVDATHGWAVGDGGTILVTANGGATWTAQTSGVTTALRAVSFVDTSHGWAVGWEGTILATSDGGATWVGQGPGTAYAWNGVSFVDATHGWAVDNSGSIAKTTDGGATWSVGFWPWMTSTIEHPQTYLAAVRFTDRDHGWAVGGGSYSHLGMYGVRTGLIYMTSDGGATWSPLQVSNGWYLSGVDFSDASHGWAVGGNGTVLATSDGGATWAAQNLGTTAALNAVAFPDATHGWVVGQIGWTAGEGGAILATTSGGWPHPVLTVTAPTAASSWPSGSTQAVSWTQDVPVSAGEFRIWLVSSGGSWYVNQRVLPVAGRTAYSASVPVNVPAGSGYRAYVYWRPTVGSGAWFATAKSTAFTVTPGTLLPRISVTAPTTASSWPSGSAQTVSWNLSSAVSAGEFRVWLVSSSGSWYVNKQVLAVGGQTVYSAAVKVSVPVGSGYRAYVYWRSTVGSGPWEATAKSAAFAVTPGVPVITVTAPTAASSWPRGSAQTVSWALSNAVSSGELRVWLVSAGGSWYVGKQVLPVAAQTAYSTSVSADVPAGSGYRAYVYWRPTVGSGAWEATAKSGAFTVVTESPVLAVTAPTGSAVFRVGASLTVSWTSTLPLAYGEYAVWSRSAGGTFYVGAVVPASGATSYRQAITLSVPTGSGYEAIVAWRPILGSGDWGSWATSPGTYSVMP